jgi:hypothetical protein
MKQREDRHLPILFIFLLLLCFSSLCLCASVVHPSYEARAPPMNSPRLNVPKNAVFSD